MRPEDYQGSDASRFEQMLATPGSHSATGTYTIDRPIAVSADCDLRCDGAVFNGDKLRRSLVSPQAVFVPMCDRFRLFGGMFFNCNIVSPGNEMNYLHVDIESHIRNDSGIMCSIISRGAKPTQIGLARVRSKYSYRTDPIFSQTIGGGELDVQLDLVENLRGYGVRAHEMEWKKITLHDSVFCGCDSETLPAVRIMQSAVATGGSLKLHRVTMQDFSCNGYVSLAYVAGGDAEISECTVRNVRSGMHERMIEAKNENPASIWVHDCVVDQSEVDPTNSKNPFIDVKHQRFIAENNVLHGMTAPALVAFAYPGSSPAAGDRVLRNNVLYSHRSPAVMTIASASDFDLGDFVVEQNAVYGQENASGDAIWGTKNPALVHALASRSKSTFAMNVNRNLYRPSTPGACLVVTNQYDTSVKPTDFRRGDMISGRVGPNYGLPGISDVMFRNAPANGLVVV